MEEPAPAAPEPSPDVEILPSPEPEVEEPAPEPVEEPAPEPVANETSEPAPDPEPAPEPAVNETLEPEANETPAEPAPEANETPKEPPAPAPPLLAAPTLSADAAQVTPGGPGVELRGAAPAASAGVRILLVRGDVATPVGLRAFSDEDRARAEPGEADADGFRVWRADGETLAFAYRLALPRGSAPGHAALRAQLVEGPASEDVAVRVLPFAQVRAAPDPVDENGTALVGLSWGGWAARPSARDVACANWLKIENVGDAARVRVAIDFGADGFRGEVDPRFGVPTVDNLEFAWWEAKAASVHAPPREGLFTWHAGATPTGDVVEFTQPGSVIYVLYRIRQMPDVLPNQPYAASLTITEV